MNAERRLTKLIASQFLADDVSVDLSVFTSIDDDAAELLTGYRNEEFLPLRGLTQLPDRVAEILGSGYPGTLELSGLKTLSDAAARGQGESICLEGLTTLSDLAAQCLSNYSGLIWLGGLTNLSANAIQSLSQSKGELALGGDGCHYSAATRPTPYELAQRIQAAITSKG
jgi:hypothetical protein